LVWPKKSCELKKERKMGTKLGRNNTFDSNMFNFRINLLFYILKSILKIYQKISYEKWM
jgi:hypothetical protein